jgi:hypothetical protein
MEPENNPTPGSSPQPETPNTEPQPNGTQPEPQSAPVQAAAAPSGEWPGAFGVFKRAAAATKVNLGAIVLFDILLILFSGADRKKGGLIVFVSFLIGVWVHLALTSLYLASSRGQKQSISDAAQAGIKHYVNGFIASFLTAIIIVVSVLALIVPFFFVAPRLQFVLFYVVDKGMGPIEALKASWADSKGFSLKIWGAIAVSILFAVLCVLIVGIYLLFMYQTVFALLYLYITGKKGAAPSQPVVDSPPTPA